MTDFDRTEYWKKRISEQLNSLFDEMKLRLRPIKDNVEHITGGTNHEFMNGILSVGDGFDMMQAAVENIGKKKDVPVKPPEGKGAKKT